MRARFLPLLFLAFPALSPRLGSQTTTPDDPRRVLVLYSQGWPDANGDGVGDSKEVALYYAKARGVPASNLLGLPLSGTRRYWSGTKGWAEFHDKLVTPVKKALKVLGPAKIDTLLFCYGVPYYIYTPLTNRRLRAVDSLMAVPDRLGTRTSWPLPSWWYSNTYLELSPSIPPDLGRFNHGTFSFFGAHLYLNCRIDGPTPEAAKDLVDGAIYAEKHLGKGRGYIRGRAYVDTRYGYFSDTFLKQNYPFGYSTYKSADECMAFGKFFPPAVGLPTFWEAGGKEIGEQGARWRDGSPALTAPRALLYGGWYNYNQYHDVWDWLPGSIACDLNSNSIRNFHKANPGTFLGSALARGLTAGSGVVGEPYLSGHPRPEVLLYYVTRGFTWAEASMVSDPALLWMSVHMGDPLYTPFRKGSKRFPDHTRPGAPLVKVVARKGTSAVLDLGIPRRPADPDLCVFQVDYGPTPALGSRVPFGKAYKGELPVTLSNLPDLPGFYFQVEARDPAGLSSKSPILALCPRPFQAVDVRASVSPATVPYGKPLTARFAVSALPGLTGLKSFKIEMEGMGSRFDLTQPVLASGTEISLGPKEETLLFALKAPALLPPGNYKFHIQASTSSGFSKFAAPFTVQ